MSKSAKSIRVFAIYPIVVGLSLVVAPNLVLALFGIPETQEVWIRVLGALAAILGYYYLQASRDESKMFFRATVYGRTAFLLFCVAFVVLGLAQPLLILFGLVDGAGAVWTGLCLRQEKAV
jgi:hypothetical protein